MMPILALGTILDGIGAVLSGIARGCGQQDLCVYANLGAYFVVGIPLAGALAFIAHLGAKWILHDWSYELCLQLLKNCHRALPENGKVIIVDVILPVEAHTQISSHVGYHVDFLMLAYNPGGEEHTPYEFKDLAKQSGFEGCMKVICTINSISVMEFYKNK